MLRKSSSHSLQFLLQCILPIFRNFSFLFLQRIFYFAFCLRRYHKCEPIIGWFLFVTGNDLNLVATTQFVTDRDQFVIYFGPDTFSTDLTMNSKSKIECR